MKKTVNKCGFSHLSYLIKDRNIFVNLTHEAYKGSVFMYFSHKHSDFQSKFYPHICLHLNGIIRFAHGLVCRHPEACIINLWVGTVKLYDALKKYLKYLHWCFCFFCLIVY